MNKKGFTMVELLVVLLIVGILAAIATPLFLAHTKRAKASEAVATMSQIRQAERDYNVSHPNSYFSINSNAIGNYISQVIPDSVNTSGVPTPAARGVDVNPGVAQYFSTTSFSVDASSGKAWLTTTPGDPTTPVDFVITANGSVNVACSAYTPTTGTPPVPNTNPLTNSCAVHYISGTDNQVAVFRLQMDNSGRIFVSYDAGVTWSAW